MRDELGITSVEYQNRALECVANFLANFEEKQKRHVLKLQSGDSLPLHVRVHENPPSVQIIQEPRGGSRAGVLRIQEKLSRPKDQTIKNIPELIIPTPQIILAEENDLTRECIIVTFRDDTLNTILEGGLISPSQAQEFIGMLRTGHPDFFLIVQRYLLGFEQHDGVQVPYGIVTQKDETTFQYLEKFPKLLVANFSR